MKHTRRILLAILALGVLVRVLGFPFVPPGINRDEAALGYNAYALLKTGSDEWGVHFPIVFRSFGDYKLAGYIYTLVPSIWAFGLTPFAVRLPSLLAGIALIPLTFLFIKKLLKDEISGLFAAFFVAISPWAIHYSHVAFEANLALALFIGGLVLLQNESWFSIPVFFLSLMTYNAPLVIMPVVLGICAVTMPQWKKLIGIFLVTILAFFLVLPATKGKGAISIFSDQGMILQQHDLRLQAGNNYLQRFVSHPIVFYGQRLVRNVFVSFSPYFLAVQGGQNPWHQAPGKAHIYWSILALSLVGTLVVIFGTYSTSKRILLFGLLLGAVLPSAITIDAPQATRMLLFFFMLAVLAGVGASWCWKKFRLGVIILGCLLVVEIFSYMNVYLIQFKQHASPEWKAGIGDEIQAAEQKRTEEQTITMFGDVHYLYIYPLFYLQVDPNLYRETVKYYPKDTVGLSQVKGFGHYRFMGSKSGDESTTILVE